MHFLIVTLIPSALKKRQFLLHAWFINVVRKVRKLALFPKMLYWNPHQNNQSVFFFIFRLRIKHSTETEIEILLKDRMSNIILHYLCHVVIYTGQTGSSYLLTGSVCKWNRCLFLCLFVCLLDYLFSTVKRVNIRCCHVRRFSLPPIHRHLNCCTPAFDRRIVVDSIVNEPLQVQLHTNLMDLV